MFEEFITGVTIGLGILFVFGSPIYIPRIILALLEAEEQERRLPLFLYHPNGKIELKGYYSARHAEYYYRSIDDWHGKYMSIHKGYIDVGYY